MTEHYKCYDMVRIKSSGEVGQIIEIDDNDGAAAPHYLIEIEDKSTHPDLNGIIFWCDWREIERI